MKLKNAWNKVKETVRDSIAAYFGPHELYQKVGGWSYHNTRQKFNDSSQNRNSFLMLAGMFSQAASPLQPAYAQPSRDLTYDV